jgi:rSAM/selenodomain-associated transferase 1
MPKPDTLLVVAKQPTPGQAKTRLCPPLTPAQAADLYDCFLRDTLALMRKVPGVQCMIGYLPEDARDYFHHLAPDMILACQRGASLGERLDRLLTEALAGGSPRAVVIDSDSPTLPEAFIFEAFEQLADADVVLGPTQDGGYYLIGMKQPQAHLLRQVQMSTPHVLTDTLALAKATGLSVSLLPAWYDVDTIADLHQLESEIAGLEPDHRAAATRRWLAQTDWRDPRA